MEAMFAFIFNKDHTQFVINFSYVEINNEQVYDLLADGKEVLDMKDISS